MLPADLDVVLAARGCQAVGRAVRQGDWVGIYCMAVAPTARRQGRARDVLHALINQARATGARLAYLCVTAANAPAQAPYAASGFQPTSTYHYRIQPTHLRT
jgi:ribosomal protein S18 acetylase RimI-like enzyme